MRDANGGAEQFHAIALTVGHGADRRVNYKLKMTNVDGLYVSVTGHLPPFSHSICHPKTSVPSPQK